MPSIIAILVHKKYPFLRTKLARIKGIDDGIDSIISYYNENDKLKNKTL